MNDRFRVGDWLVDLKEGRMRSADGGRAVELDARLAAVIAEFLRRPGELVTHEELLASAWPERVVGRDSVNTAIYQLRRVLGDSAEAPRYIRTELRRGYRLIAEVRPLLRRPRPAMRIVAVAAVALLLAIAAPAVLSVLTPQSTAIDTARPLVVAPSQNLTGSTELAVLVRAIDATFQSQLVTRHPGRVMGMDGTGGNGGDARKDALRIESELVACDLGPALVLKILDTVEQTYLWSRTYEVQTATAGSTADETLIRRMAADVSSALLELAPEG